MDRRIRYVAAVLLAGTVGAVVAGCGKPQPSTEAPTETVAVQSEATEAMVPAVVAVREAVEAALPASALDPDRADSRQVDPAAVALIVRYEVSSEAYYNARLQSPIWPGGASGVTWCIGYDGGHQTRTTIATDWRDHAAVDRFESTSGVVGQPAKALIPGLHDIRTPFQECEHVFTVSTLPAYDAKAARLFRNGWDDLHPLAQGALTSMVYNRGTSTVGNSRAEIRDLRDDCVPRTDYACIASKLRAMKRLWAGTANGAGLAKRYEDTARLVESIGAGA